MQGDAQVIELLNECLTAELTAVNQYFVHAKMQENWGYERLAQRGRDESIEEMKHAEQLIYRILIIEGVPNMQRLFPVRVGETVKEQIEAELETEVDAITRYNDGVKLCHEKGDAVSRELLERLVADETEHADWLEAQLVLIDQVGIENYLAQQIRG
ncbi:MAG: bacterioferritin [Acidimicrobiales bacterium]